MVQRFRASQSEVLSVTGGSQTRHYAYGAADATGVPELAVYTNSAASTPTLIYTDPTTGQPIFTVEQGTIYAALYVNDGIGNPVALIEKDPSTALSEYSTASKRSTTSNTHTDDTPRRE